MTIRDSGIGLPLRQASRLVAASCDRPRDLIFYVCHLDAKFPLQVEHLDGRPRRDSFVVTGEVDVSTSFALFDAVLPAVLSVNSDVVLVNLAGVTFFDSTGLDVLLGLNEIATAWGKDLLIVEPSERVLRLFELAGRTYSTRRSVCSGSRTTYVKL